MSLQINPSNIGHPDNIEELTRRGQEIYDTKLKPVLEPIQDGNYVAIHVGSGDYYVGKTASAASHELHVHHAPDGMMVLRKIGPEPEFSLAARLFAGELTGANIK